jgi:membrane associated rhomboid family serine protease
MFFPYGTDAPVYYWPFATVAFIAVCVLVFIPTTAQPELAAPYVLSHGDGIHPLQWITSNFIHANWEHLLGNMLALWSFGLIVEGKMGWWRAAAIYLGIGAVQCAVEQFAMLGASEGCSYGASAIIFGLMAMSLVWAPENKMHCIIFLGFRFFSDFEMSVRSLVGLMLLLQIVIVVWTAGAMSSELLHLMGAGAGLVVAVALLKLGWVDCENWDFFSVWSGRNTMSREELEAEAARREKPQAAAPLSNQEMLAEMRRTIQAGNALLALRANERLSREHQDWALPQPDMWNLIKLLHAGKHWSESVPLMREYLARYPQNAAQMRLTLAQILGVALHQPAAAKAELARVDAAALDARCQATYRQLSSLLAACHEPRA